MLHRGFRFDGSSWFGGLNPLPRIFTGKLVLKSRPGHHSDAVNLSPYFFGFKNKCEDRRAGGAQRLGELKV
jgi:hypothetical protein